MKKTLIILLLLYSQVCLSQGGVWTWLSGTNTTFDYGVFGPKGVASTSFHPPTIYVPVFWKDMQGDFWIYGGMSSVPFISQIRRYADMWRYSPTTNQWAWMNGPGTAVQNGVYGIQGVPDSLNYPGQRAYGSFSWVDTTGNLWLFGGTGRNDLWKYTISTNLWTWMKGDSTQSGFSYYGTKGISSSLNTPGGRDEGSSAWTDPATNTLWLYGGQGYGANFTPGVLSDLWKYEIATNEWTWINGSDTVNVHPIYGTKGVSSPSNQPGARQSCSKFVDSNGNFGIMGGLNFSYRPPHTMNDVWIYSLSTNEWTWIAGADSTGNLGSYLSTCTSGSANFPQSRGENRATTSDGCGRLWMFGGAFDMRITNSALCDFWMFDPSQLSWMWLGGSSVSSCIGNYGTQGVPSISNAPPSRFGAAAWWGDDNKFYLFGGTKDEYLANTFCDIWVFEPDSSCVPSCSQTILEANFVTGDQVICSEDCIDFTNLSIAATSFQWSFPGAIPDTSSARNPKEICYGNPGTFDVQLIVNNSVSSDTLLFDNFITVHPSPTSQALVHVNDSLIAPPGFNNYYWFYFSDTIIGATTNVHIASLHGDYKVICVDSNGCTLEISAYGIISTIRTTKQNSIQVEVFPNPSSGDLELKFNYDNISSAIISVTNTLGVIVFLQEVIIHPGVNSVKLDNRWNNSGVFFLEMRVEDKLFQARIVKP